MDWHFETRIAAGDSVQLQTLNRTLVTSYILLAKYSYINPPESHKPFVL